MVRVIFRRGSYKNVQYWTDHDCDPIPLDFLNAKANKNGIGKPDKKKYCRGIKLTKKDEIIQKLCPLMPENRREFWKNIPGADVSDLNETQE